jgi:hypothetical protein
VYGTPRGSWSTALGERRQALTPQFAWDTAQRLADMDSLGVDVQVVSTFIGYYQFPSDAQAIAACREANDEVRQMASTTRTVLRGSAPCRMQNLHAAIGRTRTQRHAPRPQRRYAQ